jgi:hypothetical protein
MRALRLDEDLAVDGLADVADSMTNDFEIEDIRRG